MVEVRHLPFAYSVDDLLQEWPVDGTWNFSAVPYNAAQERMQGYAVLNFTTPEHAQAFADRWHGYYLWYRPDTGEPLNIRPVNGNWRSYLASLKGSMQQLFVSGYLPKVVENGWLWSDGRVMVEICISNAIQDFTGDAFDAAAVQARRDAAPAPEFVPWPEPRLVAGRR